MNFIKLQLKDFLMNPHFFKIIKILSIFYLFRKLKTNSFKGVVFKLNTDNTRLMLSLKFKYQYIDIKMKFDFMA